MPPQTKPAISFSHVDVRRGERDVLTDINLNISLGENIAIVGPNGSGKSTLIKTITRELYPTSGSLRLFGKKSWDVCRLRSQLGIVSYDLQSLFSQEISGHDVVISGFFNSVGLWKNNLVTPEMERKTKSVMRWLGLTHLSDQTITHVSSGEARRLLIARALIHKPRLIVFDEPLNSLDLRAQRLVKQTLRSLARSGIGIVLVTHHLSDIIPEIKRVVLLRSGRIFQDATKEAVLTEENLKDLFEIPVGLIRKGGYWHAY